MNELARLRGSERYGACDDVVQDALFKGQSCRGAARKRQGQRPSNPLGERKQHLLMAAGCQKCFWVTLGKSNRTPACAGERIDS